MTIGPENSDAICTGESGGGAARELLERLLVAHEAYFDVERDHHFAGRRFEGYAELHSSASQYVLSKRAKLWETSSHEYMFFALTPRLDAALLDEYASFMKNEAIGKVKPGGNHMNSFLTLVIISDFAEDGAMRRVRRLRFRKNFAFGLRGWADLRICIVSLADQRVCANPMGRALVPTIEANLRIISR